MTRKSDKSDEKEGLTREEFLKLSDEERAYLYAKHMPHVSGLISTNRFNPVVSPPLPSWASEEDRIAFAIIAKQSEELVLTSDFQIANSMDPLLSEAIRKFCEERERSGQWGDPKTGEQFEAFLQTFLEIVGDVPIRQISKSTVREYKEIMMKLPANRNKIRAYRDKSPREIAQMPDVVPMNKVTLNNNLIRVNALLDWARESGYTDLEAKGVLKFDTINRKASKRNRGFTQEQLQKIVSSLLNEHDLPYWKTHPHRFWLPFLGMFTGARLNELCQLYITDLRFEDDFWIISFNADSPYGDKKLKNRSSARDIPLHPCLIELGFLRYVDEARKAGHERAFYNLSRSRDGYQASSSKWFAEFVRRNEIYVKKGDTFHNFRHTVLDYFKQRMLADESVVSGIVGHENANQTFGSYGNTLHAKSLIGLMRQLDYGLDLSAAMDPKNNPWASRK